jgi:hypothetical protein
MATVSPILKAHFVTWREWEMNPVLLKELRQAVQGQALVTVLMAMLAALFLVCLYFLVGQGSTGGEEHPAGLPMVRLLLALLSTVSIVFVPLYIGFRFAFERRKPDRDLMFFTLLAPGQIVRGKLLCGAYLVALFSSVCMPFAAFANLMRGVDFAVVLFILVCLFATACLAIQVAIFYGCLPGNVIVKVFLGPILATGLIGACAGVIRFFFTLLQAGMGTSPTYWVGVAVAMLMGACVLGFVQVLSVGMLVSGSRPPGYFEEVARKGTQ